MSSLYSNILSDECGLKFQQYVNTLKKTNYNQFYYHFPTLPFSLQYGLYVEFFDSVGIYISDFADNTMLKQDEPHFEHWGFSTEIEWDHGHIESPQYKDRIDSRKFAILKANEIYNSKQK